MSRTKLLSSASATHTLVRTFTILLFFTLCSLGFPTFALNNYYSPSITPSQVIQYLNNPMSATAYKPSLTDSAGNAMELASILQLAGQSWSYAAVYDTPSCNVNGCFFLINLAVSNDLMSWTFVRTLVPNADDPKILQVSGSQWIMITYEQYATTTPGGPGGASTQPVSVAFSLFYNSSDLLAGTIRSSWTMPEFQQPASPQYNGTPSFYNATMQLNSQQKYVVNGQYGFHFFNGAADMNAVTTLTNLFNPSGGELNSPSEATTYNSDFTGIGAIAVGDRDTLQTQNDRYNIQEVDTASTCCNNEQLWLYQYNDGYSYPTGNGLITKLAPAVPGGGSSISNPRISVVNSPSGSGHALVITYFVQGSVPDTGTLIFYYNIP